MPRIDEMPQYRANLPKNVHDLTHKLGFTATVAHLLPVFHDFLNPGETVELGFEYDLRTQPLQSAAMVDIKSHVEYFFVPIQLLYEPFGNLYYNINDYYSSFVDIRDNNYTVLDRLPVIDWSDFLVTINASYSTLVNYYECWYNSAYRLLDMLGYNPSGLMIAESDTSINHNPNVFPYPLLAYECIYQYYYRLDNRERFNNTFNWDSNYLNSTVTLSTNEYRTLFSLHYRPKDSDYFTDVKVSPIVDVLNTNVKSSLSAASSWLSRTKGGSSPVIKSGNPGDSTALGVNYSGLNSTVSPSSSIQTNFGFYASPGDSAYSANSVSRNGMDINTANIRAMFASEKLWSITGRARKRYDDQTLAHFGYQVPHDVKHEISCFGHDRGVIRIGEVISTASTTEAPLGEIAGKGYGRLDASMHKFTAPCHGVVMVILSFVPDVTYSATYLKANAVTSVNDFYQPVYDHLGMQPLFGYEGSPETPLNWSNIIGWQYRYEQWKRRYNRVSQAFRKNSGNLDSWMLDFQPSQIVNAANTENYHTYLHNPSELDQIMLTNYITTPPATKPDGSVEPDSVVYDGDPFVVDSTVHCKKVSTMSDYSLPRLDA